MASPAAPGTTALQTDTPEAQPLHHSLRLRLLAGDAIAMGPGKAALLESIKTHGSISAAAKALDMSYRRAWQLVEAMNTAFAEPLVVANKGGAGGGGTTVTAHGAAVLAVYRELESSVDQLIRSHYPRFDALLRR